MSDGKVIIDTRLSTNNLRKDISSLPNTVQRMSSPLRKTAGIIAAAFSIKKLVDFGKQAIDLASDINEVQNVVDVSFGNMSYKMEEFAKTAIETYGISKLTAKQMASTYTAMARGMGQSLDEATDKALEMTGRMADISSFYNLSIDRVNTIGRAVYSGETEPLKQIGVIMTEAQLQTFALSKGYSKLYKNMSAAEKLEVRQLYFLEQTKLAQGDFVRTQDSWANQTRMLSERWKEFSSTLGTTVLPALTSVIKLLNSSIGTLQSFADSFNRVFGDDSDVKKDSVSKPITEAIDSTEELTDSTNKQNKALNNMLGDYDELSIISSNNASDSSTSLDTTGIESSSSSINKSLDNTMNKFDKFFELIKSGDYYSVGKTISDSLKNAVDNIKWNDIYKKAGNFGEDFADFLNGLFDGKIITSITKTITGTLNTVVRAVGSFFSELNWNFIGEDIASALNYAFSNFDFARLGKAISDFKTGIQSLIIKVLQETDWVQVGESIGEFLKNIDFKKLITNFGTIAKEIVNALFTAFMSALKEAPFETLLISTFGAMKFTKLGKLVKGKGIELAKNLNTGFAKSWKSIGGLKFDLADWGATNLSEKLTVGGTVLGTAISGWNVGKAIADQFEEPLSKAYNAVTDFFGIANESTYKIKTWKDKGITPLENSLLDLNSRLDLVTSSMRDNKISRDNNFSNAIVEATTVQTLADKYLELYKNVNRTAEQEQQLQGYREALVEYAPELQSVLDDNRIGYDELKDSVYEYIGSLKEQAYAEAAKSAMTSIAEDMIENKKALDEYSDEQKQAMQDIIDNTEKAKKSYLDAKTAYREQKAYLDTLNEEDNPDFYNNQVEITEELYQKQKDLGDAYVEVKYKEDELAGTYRTLLKQQQTLTSDMNYYAEIAGGKYKEIASGAENMKNEVVNSTEQMSSSVSNTLNGMAKEAQELGKKFGWNWQNGVLKGYDKAGVPQSVIYKMYGNVPGLASGAVLPANKPFLALLGDQKNGTNIEAPLDTIKQGVAEVISSMGINGTQGSQDINLYIDGEKLFNWTRNKSNDYKNRYGQSAF